MAGFDRSADRGSVAGIAAAAIEGPRTRQSAIEPLTLEEFETRYRQLLRAQEAATANDRCVQCEHCRGCSASTFCRHSQQLIRCHYCVECEQCTDCSHCQASRALLSCHHCVDTQSSMGSTYLVRCSAMAQCNYCLGCVGLSHRDYHILNQPYDRSAYFELSRQLMRQLRL